MFSPWGGPCSTLQWSSPCSSWEITFSFKSRSPRMGSAENMLPFPPHTWRCCCEEGRGPQKAGQWKNCVHALGSRGLWGTREPPRGFPGQVHLRPRVLAALPVGGGSAPARREELQVPESRAPVVVFLALVAVSPVAAADVTSRGGGIVAFGVWAWKLRETTC